MYLLHYLTLSNYFKNCTINQNYINIAFNTKKYILSIYLYIYLFYITHFFIYTIYLYILLIKYPDEVFSTYLLILFQFNNKINAI